MEKEISVSIVTRWDTRVVADLYRAGGWWKDEWDPAELTSLMRASFAFAIAHTADSRQAVGMGRVISDGVSDAYIQDLVVIPEWRGKGVGKQILSALIAYCYAHRITWIGLIAEPGTMEFYTSMGFSPLKVRIGQGLVQHLEVEGEGHEVAADRLEESPLQLLVHGPHPPPGPTRARRVPPVRARRGA